MLNADGGVLAFGISDKAEIQDLNTIADKLDDYRKLVFAFLFLSTLLLFLLVILY